MFIAKGEWLCLILWLVANPSNWNPPPKYLLTSLPCSVLVMKRPPGWSRLLMSKMRSSYRTQERPEKRPSTLPSI